MPATETSSEIETLTIVAPTSLAGRPITRVESPPSARELIYAPINAWNKEIRLLTLLPGPHDSTVKCELKTYSLIGNSQYSTACAAPPFEALSYEWRSPTEAMVTQERHSALANRIVLQGVPFEVRSNLWLALNHVRLLDKERILWIDAICVNQEDLHERSEQVALMEIIYTRASRVRVWLGLESQNSQEAFDLLKWLDHMVSSEEKRQDMVLLRAISSSTQCDPPQGETSCWDNFMDADFRPETHLLRLRNTRTTSKPVKLPARYAWGAMTSSWIASYTKSFESLKALEHLLSRTYWSRIWIVQEFVLARAVTIHCGLGTIDWDVFVCGFNEIAHYKPDHSLNIHPLDSKVISDIQSSVGARIIKMRTLGGKNHRLLQLLEACQDSQCLDRRDRVYALLGLATDVPEDEIIVDYTKTAFKLQEDVMQFFRRNWLGPRADLTRISSLLVLTLGDYSGASLFTRRQAALDPTPPTLSSFPVAWSDSSAAYGSETEQRERKNRTLGQGIGSVIRASRGVLP